MPAPEAVAIIDGATPTEQVLTVALAYRGRGRGDSGRGGRRRAARVGPVGRPGRADRRAARRARRDLDRRRPSAQPARTRSRPPSSSSAPRSPATSRPTSGRLAPSSALYRLFVQLIFTRDLLTSLPDRPIDAGPRKAPALEPPVRAASSSSTRSARGSGTRRRGPRSWTRSGPRSSGAMAARHASSRPRRRRRRDRPSTRPCRGGRRGRRRHRRRRDASGDRRLARGTGVPLGIVPGGTGNLLAGILGVPGRAVRRDRRAAERRGRGRSTSARSRSGWPTRAVCRIV